MDERKREPDLRIFSFNEDQWPGVAGQTVYPLGQKEAERYREMQQARQRAKLSVLNLTERDKRFLKDLKIAV